MINRRPERRHPHNVDSLWDSYHANLSRDLDLGLPDTQGAVTMRIERRQMRRKQVAVETILDEGKASYFTMSGNLSKTGVFLHTKIPVRLGTNIRMLLIRPPHLHK